MVMRAVVLVSSGSKKEKEELKYEKTIVQFELARLHLQLFIFLSFFLFGDVT